MIRERWGRGDKERSRGAAGKTHRWTGRGKKNEEGKQEERYKGRNSLLVTGSLVGSSSHWNRKKRESWGCSTLQPSQTHRGGERKRETHQHMSDHSTLSSCCLSYCPLGGRALHNPTLLVRWARWNVLLKKRGGGGIGDSHTASHQNWSEVQSLVGKRFCVSIHYLNVFWVVNGFNTHYLDLLHVLFPIPS